MGAAYGFLASWMPLDLVKARADNSPITQDRSAFAWCIHRRIKHTAVNLFGDGFFQLGDNEVSTVTSLAFLDAHDLGERLPHAVLPLQVVLLHRFVVVTLTTLTDPSSTHLGEMVVDLPGDDIVVLVGPVSETEDDVFETGKFVFAVGELEGFIGKVLHELAGIVGGLTLTVGGHDEDGGAVFGNLVEILKVIVLRVANEGGETEL